MTISGTLFGVSVLVLVLHATGHAQAERWISAADAPRHVGERVTICDSVASARYVTSSPGQPTFLNLGRSFPEQAVTIVIWGSQRASFPTPPEELYRNKRVCVTGAVMLSRGRAQVVVEHPTAIRFAASVDPPPRRFDGVTPRVSDAAVTTPPRR